MWIRYTVSNDVTSINKPGKKRKKTPQNTNKTPVKFNKNTHPDLQFDSLVVSEHSLDLEGYPDGTDEGRGEGVVGVAEEERSFAHRRVADDKQLEHVVKILVGGILRPAVLLRHSHL